MKCFCRKGFTLLEIMLAIIIIVTIAGFSVPIYQNFLARNDLIIAADITAQSLRRAQSLAQASKGNSSWGVKLGNGYITIFQGDNYANRAIDLDEIFEISSNINTTSGINEVVFLKFSGLPNIAGNIILTSVNDESKTLTVNEKGAVDY